MANVQSETSSLKGHKHQHMPDVLVTSKVEDIIKKICHLDHYHQIWSHQKIPSITLIPFIPTRFMFSLGITILVATPGRLLDHLNNTASFRHDRLRWLVFDEADRFVSLCCSRSINSVSICSVGLSHAPSRVMVVTE